MFDDEFDYIAPDYNDEYEEPETWTLVSALDRVLNEVIGSNLSKKFWEDCKNPLDFLTKELNMTKMQVVVLAILVENGDVVTWKGIAKCIKCSRLSIMKYTNEIEELVAKRWLVRKNVNEFGTIHQGYRVANGVVNALQENKPFVPEKIDGLELGAFVNMVMKYVILNVRSHNTSFKEDKEWMLAMCEANQHLPLCKEVLKYKSDLNNLVFFMLVVCDYVEWGGMSGEGFRLSEMDDIFPVDYYVQCMKRALQEGQHVFFKEGLIEHAFVHGMADASTCVLTRRSKEVLLEGFTPNVQKNADNHTVQGLTPHNQIKEKAMFYNAEEQQQIERLTSLLSQENLPTIQQRLEEQGLRKGFACLFYGAPGTGKTETVLQLARRTGRDIMQVDIADMRDKYVGESEKNIKAVFERYREACKQCKVMPILFFNEADALFTKRLEDVEKSVDKMDNAMQNIILQEMETLEGILIATTNLTSNLDRAFERRFLFKVEFHMPDVPVKQKLWSSMLQGITEEEARRLAMGYNFSGGQIENIARKRAIDFILSGKHTSYEDIEAYCKVEILEKRNSKKSVIGFR